MNASAEVDATAGGRISFDPGTQLFKLDGYKPLDRVTGILTDNGLIDPQWFTTESKLRGQDSHEAIHYLNEGDLDWSTVRPEVVPFVKSWQLLLKRSGMVVLRSEVRIWDLLNEYVGTIDAITRMGTIEWVLDYKTVGDPSYRPPFWARYQTGAYEPAYRRIYGGPERRRGAVVLMPDGSMPHIVPYNNPRDYSRFLSMNDTTKTRREHGIKQH